MFGSLAPEIYTISSLSQLMWDKQKNNKKSTIEHFSHFEIIELHVTLT